MPAYSFKHRFIGPIMAGLGIEHRNERGMIVIPGPRPKQQTIRAVGKRRHARAGETVQLYYGMRTRQCFKIGDAKCLYVVPIVIGVLKTTLKFSDFVIDADAFARADGFADAADMHAFWLKEHGIGKFEGVLIRWEPLDGQT